MHRQLYVRCEVKLQITARSAVLVQGAQAATGPGTFYRARDPAAGGREKYCIPASTLKGVWRSGVEMILRSFVPWLACDPFAEKGAGQSCSQRLENKVKPKDAYGASCPVCRLFGNTVYAGRLQLQDSWAVGDPQPQTHTGIAIDRFTGGVKQGALYTYAPLPTGTEFQTAMTLDNVEFWQLGLLALVCREMNEGRIGLGSGTRKGLGHVEIRWLEARFTYPRPVYEQAAHDKAGRLAAAQVLAGETERLAYPRAEPWLLPDAQPLPATHWSEHNWTRFGVSGEALTELQRACVEDALAHKLDAGCKGFAYEPTLNDKEEANG